MNSLFFRHFYPSLPYELCLDATYHRCMCFSSMHFTQFNTAIFIVLVQVVPFIEQLCIQQKLNLEFYWSRLASIHLHIKYVTTSGLRSQGRLCIILSGLSGICTLKMSWLSWPHLIFRFILASHAHPSCMKSVRRTSLSGGEQGRQRHISRHNFSHLIPPEV